MGNILDAMKAINNYTFTENGAVAYKSTMDPVLDAFGILGAMKNSNEATILDTFMRAFEADRAKAMRLLFYMRDIRGGQGMRRVFRIIVHYLANAYPEYISNNLDNFLFFGRGDDFLYLFDTACEADMIKYVNNVLKEDLIAVKAGGSCTLLAKWMPSCNTSSIETRKFAAKFINALGVTPREYRKLLSTLRAKIDIVESKMSANKWDEIDFETLPSRAAMIYGDAFQKHCMDEYITYLKSVAVGAAKINSNTLFPVDIINKVYEKRRLNAKVSAKDKLLFDALWNALPNYFENTEETGICMCDTSGSMSGEPLMVSLALGLYCADKCKGPFKNHFITFDYKPELLEISGGNIFDKVNHIRSINPANTNFEAALQLILDAAIENNLSQEDLPSKLYVISDMQFDVATGKNAHGWWRDQNFKYKPFMQIMKEKFARAGYVMPAIVYWNVRASKCGMFQEKVDGENCCMVSGYSASLFKSVIDGTEFVQEVNSTTGEVETKQKIDPITVMNNTLMAERYDRVWF